MSSDCSCNPCSNALTTQESVASWLSNLTSSLFGDVTKTIVNGRATWSTPCDLSSTGLEGDPKLPTEGWLCYVLRLIQNLAVFVEGDWDASTAYTTNSLVTYNGSVYIALSSVPAGSGTPDTLPALWLLAVEKGDTGAAGPPGPAGPAGGAFLVYTYRTLTITTNILSTDQLIFAEPAAGAITLTLPVIATLSDGKFFVIRTNGAFNVQINAGAGNTIAGAASYTLTAAGESIEIVCRTGNTNWDIL